jgi:ATP-dependent DNA ligase
VRSCLIDGEVVCCNDEGVAEFQQLRQKRQHVHALLIAFDLLELNGTDLRREPIETRKATLASLLRRSRCAPERAPDASRRRQTSTGRHGHHVRTLKDTRINETGIVH